MNIQGSNKSMLTSVTTAVFLNTPVAFNLKILFIPCWISILPFRYAFAFISKVK